MILETCNAPEHADLPPSQIVPRLADEGIYLASESSFYRVLREADQLHHRGRSKAPQTRKGPTTHIADAPNLVWSWDISYLPSWVRGQFFYLYLIIDIYSRKIVGWEVHEQEGGEEAAALIQRSVIAEHCFRRPLVLHADNGSPMKSQTMQSKLYDLGIIPSHSRPRVSNDNPYSESLFRTLKYCPRWPSEGLESLEAARKWVGSSWIGTTMSIATARYGSSPQRSGTGERTAPFWHAGSRSMSKQKPPIQPGGQARLGIGIPLGRSH